MSNGSREEILHKIRKGLGRGAAESRAAMAPAEPAGELGSKALGILEARKQNGDKLLGRFTDELGGINTGFDISDNENELEQHILSFLDNRNITSFAIWETGLLKSLGIKDKLEGKGVRLCSPGDKDIMAAADVGITEADYAISDTGTLVLLTDGVRPRGVSLIPPIHLAVLRKQHILSNIDELYTILQYLNQNTGTVPGCVTFITGPSRTADIELSLTLGVHGPKELHVVIAP